MKERWTGFPGNMDAIGLGTQFGILGALLFGRAMLVMSEAAMVSANKNKLNVLLSEGDRRAGVLLEKLEVPERFFRSLQLLASFLGFLVVALGARWLTVPLSRRLEGWRLSGSEEVSIVLVVLFMTFVVLVFSEYVPKRAGMQHADTMGYKAVMIMTLLEKLVKPFTWMLSKFIHFFSSMFGVDLSKLERNLSLEEIRSIIEVGKERGVINETERSMLEGIFEFDNKLAREIMTPRTEVEMIEITEPISNIISKITNGNYSRVPMYLDEVDNIVGIIYIKDLFRQLINKGKPESIEDLLRKPYFAPETKFIDDLFKEMQTENAQMAILLDEYGGFSGIVTIEDLLEEIVGNIYDEHDTLDDYINKMTDNIYLIDALLGIDDFNDKMGFDLFSENADSIGGFVIEKLGRVPKKGDMVMFLGHEFRVQKMAGKRIKVLKLILNPDKEQEKGATASKKNGTDT